MANSIYPDLGSHCLIRPIHPNRVKTLYTNTFYNSKFFITSIVFAQIYQISFNLSLLQQKFSLTSYCLGTDTDVVKLIVLG